MQQMQTRQVDMRSFLMLGLTMLLAISSQTVTAGILGGGRNFGNRVGGVSIDANGTLSALPRKKQAKVKAQVPDGLDGDLTLRKISLRDLQQAIQEHRFDQDKKGLPEAIRFLGGLQRIQYVFVYPDKKDIVLAGPAEAWKFNDDGDAIGVTTGRPVVHLEDLLVALRTAFQRDAAVITCSIDPTPEGIQRMRSFVKTLGRQDTSARNREALMEKIEDALGPQTITLGGIDPRSRFAKTLVAADYRMKRMAMGFEPAPIQGMPSYLDMMGTKRVKNMMPRWWLEDHYETLLTDEEGLAWELRGSGVKAMTEDEFVADDGSRQGTGRTEPLAKKWADTMTDRYDDLSAHQAIFGQLRNCMDVAVISALIASERLHDKAGIDLGVLLDADALAVSQGEAPRHVASQASYRPTRKHLIITVSGGVQINPWKAVSRQTKSDTLAPVREKALAPSDATWWWN